MKQSVVPVLQSRMLSLCMRSPVLPKLRISVFDVCDWWTVWKVTRVIRLLLWVRLLVSDSILYVTLLLISISCNVEVGFLDLPVIVLMKLRFLLIRWVSLCSLLMWAVRSLGWFRCLVTVWQSCLILVRL